MVLVSNDIAFTTGSGAAGESFASSPLWKYFLTDLGGVGVTDLSKITSDRVVTTVLNAPLSVTGTVPSDAVAVWLTWDDDDDPYVAEGTRLLWAFRRENLTQPYYVIRGATLVQLVEDTAAQDDARTRFTGYDPWQYLFARPVCDADGNLPGVDGLSFTATQASVIIATLLGNTIANQGHAYVDAGATYIGTGFYTGTLEESPGMEIDINFPQGTSVGQAWQQITNMNVCDIVLEPIYDPFNRPNYLCQLNVYAQAGQTRDDQIFAWNLPGRSLVGLSRIQDGTQRANEIVYFTGQGGVYDRPTAPIAEDAASVAKYGEYWAQQFFPGQKQPAVVQSLADRQLALRKDGKETVTFRPAPERSPRPWQDYQLGDRVPVWAGQEAFRQLLGAQADGTTTETQYQRIYGWTANISDDALETIDPVLTSPGGFTV